MSNIEVEKKRADLRFFIEQMEERDTKYQAKTKEIFQLIEHNVIAAFEELFELDPSNVTWLDIDLDTEDNGDHVYLLTFVLHYNEHNMSPFIQQTFGCDEGEGHRLIKFGLPLGSITGSKDELVLFIRKVTNTLSAVDHNEKIVDNTTFDLSSLTDEQRKQLDFYNNTRKVH